MKAVQQDSGWLKRSKSAPAVSAADADLQRMAMTEISLRLDYATDGRLKEERLGVKKTGNPDRLFFLTATDGVFNFYQNLVKVPAVSSTPFLSPLSYSGLVAYRFKTLKVQKTGTHKIYTIAVKPRQLSNATVEGEMTISDSSWTVLHSRFSLPAYHLPEYDFFEVEQEYAFVNNTAWMVTRQQFSYYAKAARRTLSGRTTVHFTDYELN